MEGCRPPTVEQADVLLASEGDGRLTPSLRGGSIVTWGDPVGILAASAIFRLLEFEEAEAPPGFGGLGNPDFSPALAVLAVSGAVNLAVFRIAATVGGGTDIPSLRREMTTALPLTAERLGEALTRSGLDAFPGAVDHAVDRALAVLWALHGPSDHRTSARPALGWIAMDSEMDLPSRPVNIPAAPWPTADLNVRVLHAGRFHNCRIRYAIAGGNEGSTTVSVRDSLPDQDAQPWIPEDALDIPTNGYSENLDPEVLSPLATTTLFVPDRPADRHFGMLEFFERVVVRFVSTLNDRMVAAGRPEILSRIGAVIGGNMGGNLALRLSERLVTFAPWMDALVSWSPASVNTSYGRADYIVPSPGEHVDPIAKQALDRTRDRYEESESTDSRRNFIGLQMQGELLINDGTPEFEATTRLLGFFLQPLVGGLAPILIPAPFGHFVSGLLAPAVFGSAVIIAVHREDGRITALEFGGIWRPVPVEEAIAQGVGAGRPTPYYLTDASGERNTIYARRFLATAPDDSVENNLSRLPDA